MLVGQKIYSVVIKENGQILRIIIESSNWVAKTELLVLWEAGATDVWLKYGGTLAP